MTRLTKRIAAGLGALAFIGSLSACAGQPSEAAKVGDRTISVAEVDRTVAELPEAIKVQLPGMTHPSYVLNLKMRSMAAEEVATARGFDLRSESQQQLAGVRLAPVIAENEAARGLALAETEIDLLRERIGPEAMNAEFARIPVTVNPRYGLTGLEPVPLAVADGTPVFHNPSLSKPAGGPQ